MDNIKFVSELALRLLLAGILGSIIGLNREMNAKEAGIRTHFLVAFGSTLFMIASKYAFTDITDMGGLMADPSRIASGVVSGIGFLGAGTIIFTKRSVQGLTTAAGLWATSAIGLALGGGMYAISIISTIMVWSCYELPRLLLKIIPAKVHCVKIEFYFEKNFTLDTLFEILQKNKLKMLGEANIGVSSSEKGGSVQVELAIRGLKKDRIVHFSNEMHSTYHIKSFSVS